jgi:phenylalanyl-tRNA synthetase alpha chain
MADKGKATVTGTSRLLLHPNDIAVLKTLSKQEISLKELAAKLKMNYDAVMRSALTLKEAGMADIKESKKDLPALTAEGKRFLKDKFPEQRLVAKGEQKIEKLDDEEKKIGITWALKNGWVKIKVGRVMIEKTPDSYDLYEGLKAIDAGKAIDKKVMDALKDRKSIEVKQEKSFIVSATDEGLKTGKEAETVKGEVNELTSDMIVSGKWKEAKFRQYNVEAPAEKPLHGSMHPLQAYIEKIRRIFLNMGFEEMEGPEIESSFWNFDALFQPQDHPSRELADTFYLSKPGYMYYPKEVAEKVREAHEKGWKYTWNPDVAEQPVLRTHTTGVSARTLVEIGESKKQPGKYFSIGKVYRNEATDYKHLAEFYQVEGIVVWENASFVNLQGCLKEFYRQLGFNKIKFVPHYFPYTEPSMEIHVYHEQKKEWIELGGSGIFRPEVSIPLWGKYPVLAWGLGIERLPLLKYSIKDIRTFYQNDLKWLRETKID